jgi:hypothetical protein
MMTTSITMRICREIFMTEVSAWSGFRFTETKRGAVARAPLGELGEVLA